MERTRQGIYTSLEEELRGLKVGESPDELKWRVFNLIKQALYNSKSRKEILIHICHIEEYKEKATELINELDTFPHAKNLESGPIDPIPLERKRKVNKKVDKFIEKVMSELK